VGGDGAHAALIRVDSVSGTGNTRVLFYISGEQIVELPGGRAVDVFAVKIFLFSTGEMLQIKSRENNSCQIRIFLK
jgi:hypothetical protein